MKFVFNSLRNAIFFQFNNTMLFIIVSLSKNRGGGKGALARLCPYAYYRVMEFDLSIKVSIRSSSSSFIC
jgi:hypothetical protein